MVLTTFISGYDKTDHPAYLLSTKSSGLNPSDEFQATPSADGPEADDFTQVEIFVQ